jgi:hypothetical protein
MHFARRQSNLPFALQETGVLAILWWLFAGIYWGRRLM